MADPSFGGMNISIPRCMFVPRPVIFISRILRCSVLCVSCTTTRRPAIQSRCKWRHLRDDAPTDEFLRRQRGRPTRLSVDTSWRTYVLYLLAGYLFIMLTKYHFMLLQGSLWDLNVDICFFCRANLLEKN